MSGSRPPGAKVSQFAVTVALQLGLAVPPVTGMIESSGVFSIATRAAKGGLAFKR